MSEALQTVAATTGWAGRGARSAGRLGPGLRRVAMGLLGVLLFALAWETYKALGPADGVSLLGERILPRTDDVSMPHLGEVLATLSRPEVAVTGARTVGRAVLVSSWSTLRLALAGWVLGALVGGGLAVVMHRLRVLERGLLPYVVLSQTVPVIAIAPLIAGWGGNLRFGAYAWDARMSVVVVAAYLAFCPVALGALRGLQSPAPAALELFTSYAASSWQVLRRLRAPASVPFLVPALRLAAAQAVIGAIVAEISTGTGGGVGRLIISYAQQASSAPGRVYAAILGAALLGLGVSALVSLLDVVLVDGVLGRGTR